MKVIIIGSGPGGYTAAFESAVRGWDTTLIENSKLGGTCLNHGCIPAKSLRASADAMTMAKRLGEYGIKGEIAPAADGAAIQARKNRIVAIQYAGLEKTCQKLNIHYLHGTGRVLGPGKALARTSKGDQLLEGDKIIIAAGSAIKELPALPFDHENILDSNDALDLEEIPGSVAIVGAGIAGCELACIYSALGSQIMLIEAAPTILPNPAIDADLTSLLAREMRKQKISIFTGCLPEGGVLKPGKCELAILPLDLTNSSIREPYRTTVDKIIVTAGRKANTTGLGLEEAGIAVDGQGWIEVSERLETSRQGIFAIGDVIGPAHAMLAHAAAMEGRTAIEIIAGSNSRPDYTAVPSAVFTEPEIAYAGLSEATARESYREVACGMAMHRELGRAHTMGQLSGFCKLVADAETGKLLGAHIAGAHSSELIAEATLALSEKMTVYDLARVIHAHPTLSETLAQAAHEAIRNISRTVNER